MGEIGISPDRFKYGLQWWEIHCIIKGYNRRRRDLWSATRWQTYNLMCVSTADLNKAGIYKQTDLIKFPWDKEQNVKITNEDVEAMKAELNEINAQRKKVNPKQ